MTAPKVKAPKAKNAGKAVKSPVTRAGTKPVAKVDSHTGRRVVTHPVKVHNKGAAAKPAKKSPARK